MKIETSEFSKHYRLCGVVGASALAAIFYGCSSSSPAPAAPVGDDAATTPETDASTPVPEAGAIPDSGAKLDAGPTAILQKVTETNLFADTADGGAPNVDPNLVNAWGLAFNPTGTAWVSDNGTGLATLYKTNSAAPVALVVQVPLPDGGGGALYPAADSGTFSTPSGQIYNASAAVPDAGTTSDFMGDLFIISAEDGTISGWAPTLTDKTKATLRVDLSSTGAVFKGLTIVPSSPQVLIAADFHNGKIDAFDANYAPVTVATGKWTDPSIPTKFAPFNVAAIGNKVFVAYAKQDAEEHDDTAGIGNGAISAFDLTGTLVKSLVAQTGINGLNSPWALTTVPAGGWGQLPAGALLVGNFGDGTIQAFDATSGAAVGSLVTSTGAPFSIPGLWALTWGPNAPEAGATPDQLYFTAGPNDEGDGLYGYLTAP